MKIEESMKAEKYFKKWKVEEIKKYLVHVGQRGYMGNSVFCPRYFCEHKISLKIDLKTKK